MLPTRFSLFVSTTLFLQCRSRSQFVQVNWISILADRQSFTSSSANTKLTCYRIVFKLCRREERTRILVSAKRIAAFIDSSVRCLSRAHLNQSQQLHSLWLTAAIRLGETVSNPCSFIIGVLVSLNIILFRQIAFFFSRKIAVSDNNMPPSLVACCNNSVAALLGRLTYFCRRT